MNMLWNTDGKEIAECREVAEEHQLHDVSDDNQDQTEDGDDLLDAQACEHRAIDAVLAQDVRMHTENSDAEQELADDANTHAE